MNLRKFLMFLASIGLMFGMMTGCGGGSSSSGGGTPPNGGGGTPPAAGLDNQKVNKTATRIADTLGCDYSTVTTSQNKKLNMALVYKTSGALKTVMDREAILESVTDTSSNAKDTQEITGDCGGTLSIVTEGDASETGDETIDLTFTNYCNSETVGVATTLNGSLNIVLSQTSETSMTIAASTGTPLSIKATNPNTSENMDATIDLQDGEVVINTNASGDMTSIKLTASSVKLTDNVSGETCTATNLVADVDMVTQATTFSATVSCAGNDTGSLSVSGTADASGQVTLEVTDENGKKGMLKSTDSEGVFDVSFDGVALGKMDCSMVDVPEIPAP